MRDSLGARLRQERESKQIPLASIAASTKIKLEWLDGLENDDVSKWPSGIFRRAFIRSYAQAIGLQPDTIVREFVAFHPDPEELERSASVANRETAEKPPSGSAAWIANRLNAAIRTAKAEVTPAPAVDGGARTGFALPIPVRNLEPLDSLLQPVVDALPAPIAAAESTLLLAIDDAPNLPFAAEESAQQREAPILSLEQPLDPPADYEALANLCTLLASVVETDEVCSLLGRLGELLDSTGVVVWMGDRGGRALFPVLWWGYSAPVFRLAPVGIYPDPYQRRG